MDLLKDLTEKYVPGTIGHADLWALVANVAIEMYQGPHIETLFGRNDAVSHEEGVQDQTGRLPDGDKGRNHLRDVFWAKGFDDKDIVALSGAHTLGRCHVERSGFDGPWTENPLKFDNDYFKDMLSDEWVREVTEAGKPQFRHKTKGTMMLISDMALIEDSSFKGYVEMYAKDEAKFFEDFADAWGRLQILGYDKSKLTTDLSTFSKL